MTCRSGEPRYLGRIAYEAYCKSTDGKSAITGADLPTFYDTPLAVQEAWVAAAGAIKVELDSKCGCIHGS